MSRPQAQHVRAPHPPFALPPTDGERRRELRPMSGRTDDLMQICPAPPVLQTAQNPCAHQDASQTRGASSATPREPCRRRRPTTRGAPQKHARRGPTAARAATRNSSSRHGRARSLAPEHMAIMSTCRRQEPRSDASAKSPARAESGRRPRPRAAAPHIATQDGTAHAVPDGDDEGRVSVCVEGVLEGKLMHRIPSRSPTENFGPAAGRTPGAMRRLAARAPGP